MGKPSVYPTGVTIYDREKAYNGYTIYPAHNGAALVDMNGRIVKLWEGITDSMPVKLLPGGNVMGSVGRLKGGPWSGGTRKTVQADWDGKLVWSFQNLEPAKLDNGDSVMASRQHHDFQREGSPVGYYAPGSEPRTDGGTTLILSYRDINIPEISPAELMDDRIVEVSWSGEILWDWCASDHFDEFGLDDDARASIAKLLESDHWIHVNSASYLGKNRHYDCGDSRFAPENIICSSRNCNIIFIIEKKSGKVVWRVGPDYLETPELRELGQIIGQHHAHMIPDGLPGAGNILVFDNGSYGGYGKPTGTSPDGTNVMRRHYSRALEFNPVSLALEWEYSRAVRQPNGHVTEFAAQRFFSPFISGAQRLPNGNTLITQGADGIVIEVTADKEIVWEFINPTYNSKAPEHIRGFTYRAYRAPYDWVPQLDKPEEISVVPPDIRDFRLPGSFPFGDEASVSVKVDLELD